MSNRERCHAILDSFTDGQLASIISLLTSAKALADEAADDAYCLQLYNNYMASDDKGDFVSIEDAAASLGISL